MSGVKGGKQLVIYASEWKYISWASTQILLHYFWRAAYRFVKEARPSVSIASAL
jgi:hypothetical protein